MLSNADEKKPLIVFSSSLDLYLTIDMETPSLGTLEFVLPLFDPSESLTFYSFKSVVLPSDEDLLEAMVESDEKKIFNGFKLIKK
jgi:hypothetical protein